MATKFRTPFGTQPNASGLEQIPAGTNRIPQSFLNDIGRKIDQSTIRFGGDFLFQQLPGGTIAQEVDRDIGTTHPFKVSVVGKSSTKIKVKIAEGRIFGRVEGSIGDFRDDGYYLYQPNSPLGIPGIDWSYGGGWPNGNSVPDTSGGNNPTSQGTQKKDIKNGSAGTYHSDKQSGNAGSVTNTGQGNSGTYHNPVTSGNAGSVTNSSQGSSGTYHSDPSSKYNQVYNKSYDGLGNGGGTFVNPPKQ